MSKLIAGGWIVVGTAAWIVACSASSAPDSQVGSGGSGNSSGVNSGGNAGTRVGSGGSGGGVMIGGRGGGTSDAGLDPDAPCQAVSEAAKPSPSQPADILWAIDTSCSMLTESLTLQNHMNDFATKITNSGIDVHVGLLAAYATLPIPPWNIGVCIPPPLGNGMCPAGNESKPPNFLHVPGVVVASTNALPIIINSFNGWRSILRPGSLKHIAVVTDDDAEDLPYGPAATGSAAASATKFITDLKALDPLLSTVKISSVYCFTNCPNAASIGTVWAELVKQTGGVQGDLCVEDYRTVVDALASKIITEAKPLECQWKIPPVPAGQTFDPARVNVALTDTASNMTQQFYSVEDASKCDPQLGGWYYDSNAQPSLVLACPATCEKIKATKAAKIDVQFGCARIVQPPPS